MDLELAGKVAIVTGGSRGLGKAICCGLAAEGAHVAVNYRRDADAAERLAAEIDGAHRTKAMAVQADVSHAADVARLFRQVESRLGLVDVLVNNVGVWPTAYVKEMTLDQWNEAMAVNLSGPFLACRGAVRRWRAAGRRGTIVNISSQAAYHGSTTGHAHYAASKAGLVSLTLSLAREVAPYGIRVNAIAAGMMATDMARGALQRNAQAYLDRIPLGRVADPSEIAPVVVFLASERASYMTGATVNVTGGMLMR
jgi:3-oxoacyl-[acyl-carrier protein] reductase